jgi:hypothetical protein
MIAYCKYTLLVCSYLLLCNLAGYCAQAGAGAIAKDNTAHFRWIPSSIFARRDSKMAVFIMWDPKEEIKTSAFFQVYDANNKAISLPGKFKESKLNFRPGQKISSSWEWKIPDMPVGIYRIDILINNEPAGRTFFKIE